ncbi:ankyrin repeat-containing protein [Diaporthe australafricana]|uniref:Ankyrin repeat-containing protein n=1 Tax=Diaporthe australafricana TaxID=127596 RepID=A0ABR3X5R7_9PEZI
MAPKLSEDDIDDLIYFARAGEVADLNESLATLSSREGVSPAEIITAAKDEGKSTCLHMATGNGHLEIVKIILSHFADRPKEEKQALLDAQNEFGNTGLHWAALGGHLELVKLLVAEGASPAVANDKNYVPLDSASFGEKHDVVDFFLGQMEKLETENGDAGGGLEKAAGGLEVSGSGGDGEGEEAEFVMKAGVTEDGKGDSAS